MRDEGTSQRDMHKAKKTEACRHTTGFCVLPCACGSVQTHSLAKGFRQQQGRQESPPELASRLANPVPLHLGCKHETRLCTNISSPACPLPAETLGSLCPPPSPGSIRWAPTHHPCASRDAISTLTCLGPLQEAAITVDYQPDNDRPRKERHRANSTALRLAYSSTLRTLIAIYVPSVRENHNSCAGSLLLPSLLFVGVTSYNHNRNFQNPYLP